MADFTKLSDVAVVETPSDTANVLIEEDGVIKKAPKNAVGGGNKWDAVIELYRTDDDEHATLLSGDYNTIYNKIMVTKEPPMVKIIKTAQYGDFCYSVHVAEEITIWVSNEEICIKEPECYGRGWGGWLHLRPDNTIRLI